jgi:nitrous oxidase accessory protein NosD
MLGILFAFALHTAPAQAQATRTWVSGVGDDANPCSRTAPCKTFAGAISKTLAGGEIDCLDSGGFGGITITKAITLNCSATLGSILVAGTPAVSISAGTNDKVILRGLQLQGLGPSGTPGTYGVRINTAAVVSIEDCVITQFGQQGISDARTAGNTKLFVRNTIVSHNTSTGIAFGATAPNHAVIENSHIVDNLFGIAVGSGKLVMVTRSVISGNTTGIEADNGGGLNLDSRDQQQHDGCGVAQQHPAVQLGCYL